VEEEAVEGAGGDFLGAEARAGEFVGGGLVWWVWWGWVGLGGVDLGLGGVDLGERGGGVGWWWGVGGGLVGGKGQARTIPYDSFIRSDRR
jgi:hypothetical protein